MRADAVASVQRILDAAKTVFATGDGSGTLSRIAQEAGVGIATLYRHFPSRQTLAEAVYADLFSTEVEPLLDRVENQAAGHDALLDLADRIVQLAEQTPGLVASLDDMGGLTSTLLQRHAPTFERIVATGQDAGNLRGDISSADVPRLLAMFASAGVAIHVTTDARRRYLGILLDGLRPQP